MPKKSKPVDPPKKRNPLALNPLLRKSHPHAKSKKAERARDKRILKKEIDDSQGK